MNNFWLWFENFFSDPRKKMTLLIILAVGFAFVNIFSNNKTVEILSLLAEFAIFTAIWFTYNDFEDDLD